jgi:septal ring factor EnvC (AmiA/AmiB activator)
MDRLKTLKRELRAAQTEERLLGNQIRDLQEQIREEEAYRSGEKKQFVPKRAQNRYLLAVAILRRNGVMSTDMFRERRKNGDVTIKVWNGLTPALKRRMTELADERIPATMWGGNTGYWRFLFKIGGK